ncbi:MAG: translation initiation factor IF-3 [Solirubrobacteraceae bacterium]|nr:translation initiation factor IF-3 [Solirubrobacteraceae bacterium]
MPDRDTTRINERIRVPEVRLIDENGEQVGILPTDQALRMAQDRELDLVEVAAQSRPPVCRILDYSKYKYEQAQKAKQARKHQTTIVLREIKFRPKIAQHDYDTKKGHVERFLLHKDKVKVTIMFRGREVTHPERGQMILERLAEELEEIAQVDQRPQQDGRNMTMMLSPSKAVIAGQIDAEVWKNRTEGQSAIVDPDAPTGEGITVEGPGEERSEAPAPAEPRPPRQKKSAAQKAEEKAANDQPKPAPVEEPVAEVETVEAPPEPDVEPDVTEAAPEPEPEAEAPEPEPEPAPEPPKPEKPKKPKPAPVSKAEAAAKRKPKPLMNLGTPAARPGSEPDADADADVDADAEADSTEESAEPKKKPAAKKAPTKAAAVAAAAAAKKPAAKKPAAKKPAAKKPAAAKTTSETDES